MSCEISYILVLLTFKDKQFDVSQSLTFWSFMMTSSNGNIFPVTGHLCGEFTGEFPTQGQGRGALMFSLICA